MLTNLQIFLVFLFRFKQTFIHARMTMVLNHSEVWEFFRNTADYVNNNKNLQIILSDCFEYEVNDTKTSANSFQFSIFHNSIIEGFLLIFCYMIVSSYHRRIVESCFDYSEKSEGLRGM